MSDDEILALTTTGRLLIGLVGTDVLPAHRQSLFGVSPALDLVIAIRI